LSLLEEKEVLPLEKLEKSVRLFEVTAL